MNAHVPQTKDQLVELLEYILAAVKANDSMEGFLSYLMPQDGDEPCDFMVQAAFRTGNRMGQGSMILVQRIEPASTSTGPSDPIPTNMPDLASESLDKISLQGRGPEVELMLKGIEKPRTNLGSSGPPGRVD